MRPQLPNIQAGFRDAIHDSQAVFRSIMRAMSQPALPVSLPTSLAPPSPLIASAAAILIALADFETSIWLDAPLAGSDAVCRFAGFHTGARLVGDPAEAHFALASTPQSMPRLAALSQGTPEYPDRSTTLVVQVAGFGAAGLVLTGPGIRTVRQFSFRGMPGGFKEQLVSNRAQFPCGVDIVLAGPAQIAALPRSVRLAKEG
jgi:alpha-D-ribose 1-methylphosphonate 5-triphosphate synthase subunit PhnH